jgi:DNA polymerase III subunit delta
VPSLSLEALKQHIASRRLATVYLFVGDDTQLVDRMVGGLESVIDEADRPFACERLYAGDEGGSPVQIVSSSRMLPMLGDRRIVVVMRAERLLKPKRAGRSGDEDEDSNDGGEGETVALDAGSIEEYLASPVPSTTLVFVASDIDRGRRLTKRVLEHAQVVTCAGLAVEGDSRTVRQHAALWLKDELVRLGRTIEPEAAQLLAGRAGGEISKLRGDVEKLLLFVGSRVRITTDDVMEVVSDPQAVDDDWAVVNAIAAGDAARALVETGRRFERGDSAHALVGQLRWWVSAKLSVGDAGRVKQALDALLRTDLALKSSGGDAQVLVERLVVELTGRPLSGGARGWR